MCSLSIKYVYSIESGQHFEKLFWAFQKEFLYFFREQEEHERLAFERPPFQTLTKYSAFKRALLLRATRSQSSLCNYETSSVPLSQLQSDKTKKNK